MVEFAPFKCDSRGDHNSSDLCFNGGACTLVTLPSNDLIETCTCPKGYLHDFTAGHFPNCGLPQPALAIMFGIASAIYLISIFVAGPIYFQLRAGAQRVIRYQLIVSTMSYLALFAMWIEQGMFEAAIILFALRNIMNYRALIELLLIFTAPIHAMLQEHYETTRRAAKAVEAINIVGQLGLAIAMMVLCREPDPKRYNFTVALFFAFFAFMTVAVSSLILRQVIVLQRRLIVQLRSSSNPKMSSFAQRLVHMKQMAVALVVVFLCISIFPICILTVGSLPGQYLFIFFMALMVPGFTVRGALLLRTERPETGSSDPEQRSALLDKGNGSKESKAESEAGSPESGSLGVIPKRLLAETASPKLSHVSPPAAIQEAAPVQQLD